MSGIRIPTLNAARLTLRALRPDDHANILAMSHDPEVVRHLNEGEPPTAAQVWRRMAFALGQWGMRGYGMMALDDAEGFVGRLGVFHPYDAPEPQLSYILCRRGWGRGYASEAGAAMLDWMFATHRPARIVSHIAPDNAPSARVAAKLGAVREGTTGSSVPMDVWSYPVPY